MAVMKSRMQPARVEYKNMKFLIMDRPSKATMSNVLEELTKNNCHVLVRVCDATYDTDVLQKAGVKVIDWPFDDGAPPPKEIVEDWFSLCKERFRDEPDSCVGIHCVAGLGRAPVLVALALMEGGMKYEDSVQLIRENRRGAINAKQLSYLEKYKARSRLKVRNNNNHRCVLQ